MEQLRKLIDDTDREITKLFEQRMNIVKEIANYKKANGVVINNSIREQEVIEKNIALLKDKGLEPFLKEFYISLMDISKKYQMELNK
ncbi:MAG: chorismate mutase [Clostridia bacterium]|nr:chorismate mutase [Clostridia bacterium]